jgi:hypothetical protein
MVVVEERKVDKTVHHFGVRRQSEATTALWFSPFNLRALTTF